MSLQERICHALSQRTPTKILEAQALSGGCINQAQRLRTDRGEVFVKSNAALQPGLFSAEAAGLQALRESPSALAVPRVLAFEDPAPSAPGFLVLEYLGSGRPGPQYAATLGRGLAQLHTATSASGFGLSIDTYCGTTLQNNGWLSSWPDFYGTRRIEPLTRHLVEAGLWNSNDARACERLVLRFGDLLGGSEQAPALIHGDLWSGNVHATAAGEPALIDPAAYYGHPEAELGMMTLFGGFSAAVFEAYEEVRPLASDWRQRTPLYELYHVMNHAHLFQGSYVDAARRIVRRYVS